MKGYRAYPRSLSFRQRQTLRPPKARRPSLSAGSQSRRRSSKTQFKLFKKPKIPTRNEGPISVSYGRIPYKREATMPKFMKLSTGMQTVVADRVAVTSWVQGAQSVINGAAFFSYEDLVSFNDLSAAITTVNGNLNTKVFVQGCKSKMMLTNQTTDIINVTLYDCVARYGGSNSNYYTPEAAWNSGLTYANGQQAADNRPGSTPFTTPGFTENWYVAKTTKVIIGVGGHHEHRYNIKCNQIISRDLTLKSPSTNACFPKLSAYTMVVCHGYPVNETGGSTVTTASGKLDIVQLKEYRLRLIGETPSSLKLQTTALTVNATQSMVNDASGAVSTVQTA